MHARLRAHGRDRVGQERVAARFRERGVPIVDADALVARRRVPGQRGARAPSWRRSARASSRPTARSTARSSRPSSSPTTRSVKKLNAIMHPRIAHARRAAHRRARRARRAARLLRGRAARRERPRRTRSGRSWSSRPPLEVQVARAKKRDGAAEAEVLARIAAQLPLAERSRPPTWSSETTAREADLRARADERARRGVPRGRGRSGALPTSLAHRKCYAPRPW